MSDESRRKQERAGNKSDESAAERAGRESARQGKKRMRPNKPDDDDEQGKPGPRGSDVVLRKTRPDAHDKKLAKAARKAAEHGLPPLRAHDVRLVLCAICKGPGLPENLLTVAVFHEDDIQHFHVECYAANWGEDRILELPKEEHRKVRICQVAKATFKKLMEMDV